MFAQRFIIHGLRMSSSRATRLPKMLYSESQSVQYNVKDIEIPIPWGKISGKLWGSDDKQPILAMHGWQDNAASFDNIAPLIMKTTPVLAIDLPGHGLSSWLPPGFMYTELVYLLLIKRIKRYFGWDRVKVMAHSLSAMTIYWYAATFPTELRYAIALDILKFPSIDAGVHAATFGSAIDAFLKLEEGKARPRYTRSEIAKRRSRGYANLGESESEVLMARGAARERDGTYVLNRDPRLRVTPIHTMFSQDQLEEYANLITCPYLIIKGDPELYGERKENFYRVLEILRAGNEDVYFETLSATHHLHLTHPEITAAIINPFLEKYD